MSGKLLEIEISDFKSFHGSIVIELIKTCQWLAVIEQSGLGKSNFKDAIALALGELPDSELGTVEYRDANGNTDQSGNTFVAIKLRFDDGKIKTFECSISKKQQKFSINNKVVTKKDYIDGLKDGLNVVPKNILVDQNAVNLMIDQSPEARTLLFEEVCGSIKFKGTFDRLRDELEPIDLEISNLRLKKKTLMLEQTSLLSTLSIDKDSQNTLKEHFFLLKLYKLHLEYEYLQKSEETLWSDVIDETNDDLSELINELILLAKNTERQESNEDSEDSCGGKIIKTLDEFKKYRGLYEKELADNLINLKKKKRPEYFTVQQYEENRFKVHEKCDEFMSKFIELHMTKNTCIIFHGKKFALKIPMLYCKNCDQSTLQNEYIKKLAALWKRFMLCFSLGLKYCIKYNELDTAILAVKVTLKSLCANARTDNIVSIYKPLTLAIQDNYSIERHFDFTKLTDYQENLEHDSPEFHEFYSELTKKLDSIKTEIENIQNLHETLKNNKKELKIIDDKLKIVFKPKKLISRKFDVVKKNRSQCFMDFYAQVDRNFAEIFKMLSGEENTGAKLVACNSEEPYLSGIKMECMGQSTELLDKNHKTLVALSFIFALRSVRPASFLFLDNIDSQLDREQSSRLAKYLGHLKTKQQIVLIRNSWSDEVFKHSDVVIRIAKPMENQSRESILSLVKY